MTSLVPILASSGPLLAGWAVHASMLARQLESSRRDPVTTLPTRAAWTCRARKMTRSGGRAVMLLDLDKFKEVNDTYGHAAGDLALTTAAFRLRSWAEQAGGAVGRLGGDEFAVVTRGFPSDADLDGLIERLATPFTLPDGNAVATPASVGVAVCQPAGLTEALRAADAAMYLAKHSGGGWRCGGALPAVDPIQRVRHHGPAEGQTLVAERAAGKNRRPQMILLGTNRRQGDLHHIPVFMKLNSKKGG